MHTGLEVALIGIDRVFRYATKTGAELIKLELIQFQRTTVSPIVWPKILKKKFYNFPGQILYTVSSVSCTICFGEYSITELRYTNDSTEAALLGDDIQRRQQNCRKISCLQKLHTQSQKTKANGHKIRTEFYLQLKKSKNNA